MGAVMNDNQDIFSAEAVAEFERALLRAHGPLPPPRDSCPIGWQPSALAPVFYGARDLEPADGAPVPLRIFFPSLDGAVFTAPILDGCGRYPLILFAHGHCPGGVRLHEQWFLLPAQLARSGYVVVVPLLAGTASGTHPSENDGDLATLTAVIQWAREEWEHRDVLMDAAATGIAGHSFGALVAARFASEGGIAAFAGLSGVWQDWPSGPLPIAGVDAPTLLVWGGPEDSFTQLSDAAWNQLARPRHRAVFSEGLHWDYLPVGASPCDTRRGACRYLAAATADLVTMLFAKYLPPELATDLPGRIPDDLTPPPLILTPEQEFFAGGFLYGMRAIQGSEGCALELDWATPTQREVPHVLFLPQSVADLQVRRADLVPRFSGPGGRTAWVASQSPRGGRVVECKAIRLLSDRPLTRSAPSWISYHKSRTCPLPRHREPRRPGQRHLGDVPPGHGGSDLSTFDYGTEGGWQIDRPNQGCARRRLVPDRGLDSADIP